MDFKYSDIFLNLLADEIAATMIEKFILNWNISISALLDNAVNIFLRILIFFGKIILDFVGKIILRLISLFLNKFFYQS